MVHELLTGLITANDRRYEQQFATQQEVVATALAAQDKAMNANDRRYEQQFIAHHQAFTTALAAQDKAVTTALAAQDKAVSAALAAQEKAVEAAFAAAQQAVDKAEVVVERRLEGTNEWRAAMNDRERTFMPRQESERRAGALEEKVAVLAERVNAITGRSRGIGDTWQYLVAGLGVAAAVISAVVILLTR
ncbi:MAG TPA: hypothetical protein VGJ07_29005 [Rugosimonospora sp.]